MGGYTVTLDAEIAPTQTQSQLGQEVEFKVSFKSKCSKTHPREGVSSYLKTPNLFFFLSMSIIPYEQSILTGSYQKQRHILPSAMKYAAQNCAVRDWHT